MTQYGQIPGVQVTTSAGTVSGVTIGTESYLVLVGLAPNASAEPNEPIPLESRDTVVEEFGEDSDILVAFDQARANGADPSFMVGIHASTSGGNETPASTSGTLDERPTPYQPHFSGTDQDVNFVYGEPETPDSENTININPVTREWDADDSVDEIDYRTANWEEAIRAAEGALSEGEFGVIAPLTLDSDAVTELQTELTTMRERELKMAVGVVAAEPNMTVGDEQPGYDTTEIASAYNDDTLFSVAGAVLADRGSDQVGYTTDALGAVAGLFAAAPNTDPVYDDNLTGVGELAQSFSRADITAFRDEYIIPIRDTGTVRVMDNHSTYNQDTDGGWERDFFRRRIVDLATVTSYRIARRQIGGILDTDTVADVEDALTVELEDLADDSLLEPGGQEVNAYRSDDKTIGVDLQISPFGVAKAAEVDLEILA